MNRQEHDLCCAVAWPALGLLKLRLREEERGPGMELNGNTNGGTSMYVGPILVLLSWGLAALLIAWVVAAEQREKPKN